MSINGLINVATNAYVCVCGIGRIGSYSDHFISKVIDLETEPLALFHRVGSYSNISGNKIGKSFFSKPLGSSIKTSSCL